jgi:hypothetical protein
MVLKSNNNRDLTKGGRFPRSKNRVAFKREPIAGLPLNPERHLFFLKISKCLFIYLLL